MRQARGPGKNGRKEREMLVRLKELSAVGKERGVQQLLRCGNIDFAVIDAEVIAGDPNRTGRNESEAEKWGALHRGINQRALPGRHRIMNGPIRLCTQPGKSCEWAKDNESGKFKKTLQPTKINDQGTRAKYPI